MTNCRLYQMLVRWRELRIRRIEDQDLNCFTSLEVLYRDKIRRLEAENKELREAVIAFGSAAMEDAA